MPPFALAQPSVLESNVRSLRSQFAVILRFFKVIPSPTSSFSFCHHGLPELLVAPLALGILSAVAPPLCQGNALQFNQGGNGMGWCHHDRF